MTVICIDLVPYLVCNSVGECGRRGKVARCPRRVSRGGQNLEIGIIALHACRSFVWARDTRAVSVDLRRCYLADRRSICRSVCRTPRPILTLVPRGSHAGIARYLEHCIGADAVGRRCISRHDIEISVIAIHELVGADRASSCTSGGAIEARG